MTPVGKIVKFLLALTVAAAVAAGVAGCKKEEASAPQAPAAPPAAAPAPARQDAPAAAPTEAAAPSDPKAPREVTITVTEGGYEPSPVTLHKGQPVTLKVTRTTDNTCATELVIDEHEINQKLPLNETVTVQFTPKETGELKYGCGMDKMISGRFLIQ